MPTLIITNSYGISLSVNPTDIELLQEGNEPASLACTFHSNTALFSSSENANPVQLNASVKLTRGTKTLFEGNIVTKPTVENSGGQLTITITAQDKLWQGKYTKASQNGKDNWENTSPTASITNIEVMRTAQVLRRPYNRATTSFIPSFDTAHAAPNFRLQDWDNAAGIWLALDQYNSSPLSNTAYTTKINKGKYTVATATLNTPIVGQATITINIAGMLEVEKEFIVGERVLFDGNKPNDYTAHVLVSKSLAGTTLSIVLANCTALPPATPYYVRPLTLKLSTKPNGLFFGGYILIDDEAVRYDGYDIDASGIYTLKTVARGSYCFPDLTITSGIHYLYNEYTAAISGTTINITGGSQYDIKISQNALFPVAAVIELFNGATSLGNFTIATSSWNSVTKVCSITVNETLPASVTKVKTQNRVINIYPQKIAPGNLLFEGYAGGTWNIVKPEQYFINFATGVIETQIDWGALGLKLTSTTWDYATKHRISLSYYDELNSNTLLVSDVIKGIVEAPQTLKGRSVGETATNGGWQLPIGSSQVIGLDDRITKVGVSEPQLTFEFIDDFINNLGYTSNEETVVNYFWDSEASKFTIKRIIQETPAKTYRRALEIKRDSVLDEVYSGILFSFTTPAPKNFATALFWGPTDAVYAPKVNGVPKGVAPSKLNILTREEGAGLGWKTYSFSSSFSPIDKHYFGSTFTTDYLDTTGYSLEYGSSPGTTAPENQYTYFVWTNEPGYFSGVDCGTEFVEKIRCVVDVRQEADKDTYTGDFSIDIQVVGIKKFKSPKCSDVVGGDDFAPEFSEADVVELPELRVRYQGDQDLRGVASVVLEADVNMDLAAVCVKYNACPTDGGAHVNTFCRLKELSVLESTKRSVFVRISDQAADGDAKTLYAPKTYKKLIQPNHKILEIDNGNVLYEGAAISLARALLLQRLVLEDSREFILPLQESEEVPKLSETVKILTQISDYTGVVLVRKYVLENGNEKVSLVLRDFTAPILT